MDYSTDYYVNQALARSTNESLSAEQAAVLQQSYENGALSQIVKNLNDQSASVAGKTTLNLYSGADDSNISYGAYANAETDVNGSAYTIDQTAATNYLMNEQVSAVEAFNVELRAAGLDTIPIIGNQISGQAYTVLEPLWRINSENTVTAALDNGVTLNAYVGDNASLDSVFFQNELPLAIDAGQSVNGISADELTSSSALSKLSDYTSSQDLNVAYDISTQKLILANGSTTDPYISAFQAESQLPAGEATYSSGLYNIYQNINQIGIDGSPKLAGFLDLGLKGAGAAGAALVAYDILRSSDQAVQQVEAGDNAGAALTMENLSARISAGVGGFEVGAAGGAEVGGSFGALIGPEGVPIGAAIGGFIGGVGGSIFGAQNAQNAVDLINAAAQKSMNSLKSWILSDDPNFSATTSSGFNLSSLFVTDSNGQYVMPVTNPFQQSTNAFGMTIDGLGFISTLNAGGGSTLTFNNSAANGSAPSNLTFDLDDSGHLTDSSLTYADGSSANTTYTLQGNVSFDTTSNYDNFGDLTGTEQDVYDYTGGNTLTITDPTANIFSRNDTITLAPGITTTINGDDNLIIGGSGISITGFGTGNTAQLGSGSTFLDNLDNNTSTVQSFGSSSNVSSEFENYSGANGTGNLLEDRTNYFNGTFDLTQNTYNPSGSLTGSVFVDSLSSGAFSTNSSGYDVFSVDAFGHTLTLDSFLNGTLTNAQGQVLSTYAPGALAYIGETESGNGILGTVRSSGSAGDILNLFQLNANGTQTSDGYSFNAPRDTYGSSFSQLSLDTSSLDTLVNSLVGLDGQTTPINNAWLPVLSVTNLGALGGSGSQSGEDTGSVVNGTVISEADARVSTGNNAAGTDSNANTDGLATNASTNVVTGDYRPGNSILQTPENILGDLVGGIADAASDALSSLSSYFGFSSAAAAATHLLNTDPLLIDLTGQGIQISNWINSPAYFDSNVGANGLADGQLHRTSWTRPGTGIMGIDINGDGKIDDITETLSQFLQLGPTPGAYADGLSALAALTQAGATQFNAQTSLIDPRNGKSYWNEVVVWQDANQNGTTDAGELKTLPELGITSISLAGSGNQGENINGSSVTNRATYTKTDGSTGQVAAVNLQTDSTGNISISANGGVTITSTSEGGATTKNSFVDQSATGQSYALNNGALTRSGASVASGITAFFATNQNDTITVTPSDTTSYWLGGGVGAATLNGGAGNTMFLINHQTVVHGGGTRGVNFNIAEVIDSAPITVDLKTSNLDEVIGGAGNGTFNASGTTWDVFIQGGSGNNIIIGGAAHDALSGGTGDDLIEAGSGGSIIHAGTGNDVIYGGSGTTSGAPNSDIIYGGPGHDTVTLGTNNSEVVAGTGSMSLMGNASGFSVLRLHGSYADYTITHNADGTTTITDKKLDRDGPVTFKNITAYDFADINQIPVANVNPLPANDIVHVSGNGPYTISASMLLGNDIDLAGNTVAIRELVDNNGNAIARGASSQVNGGTAALSSDGSTITFTPQTGFTGVMSFRYHAKDNLGHNGAMVQQIGTTTSVEMTATVSLLLPNAPTNTPFAQQWYLAASDVLPAWAMGYTGAGVKVGVFDPSGNADFTNPGLTANEGGEFKNDGTPGVEQIGTHATLVSGVIAGVLGGTESVGVAYGATLYSESLNSASVDDFIDLTSINDWSKYDVVNNSWGITPAFADNFLNNPNYADAFENAATTGRNGLGTVIVFSGGNDRATGGNTNYANNTNSQYEITVGGINAPSDLGSLQISGKPFSNPGTSILVSAPANNITSTSVTMTNEYGQQFGADSETVAGTSLAAPIVSGVVALMLQANPQLGARDVQEILAMTAKQVDLTGSNWTFNGSTNWNGGGMHTSDDYGFGEVDAAAAVRLARTWTQNDTFNNESSLGYTGGAGSPGLTGDSLGVIIPVDQGTGTPYIDVNLSSEISGLTMKAQHIDVEISLSQVRLSDITIKLVSATTGETSTLLSRPTSAVDAYGDVVDATTAQDYQFTFDTVKDWGETNQDYHVVISYAAGTTSVGRIVNPLITTVYGDITGSGNLDTIVYTDEFGQLSSDSHNAARSTLIDSSPTAINAAAVSSGVTLNLVAGSTNNVIAGRALTIAATTNVTVAYGGAGNNTITGNNSGDQLFGGQANDIITGGTGSDTIGGFGGIDILNGGAGVNTVSYDWATGAMTVNLVTGTDSTGSTLANFQNVIDSNFGDTVTVGTGLHTLTGGTGNDTFNVGTLAAGSVVQGNGGSNTLVVTNGDITQATLSNIQVLTINGTATLTVAQITSGFTIGSAGGPYGVVVSDTAAHVSARLAALQTLAAGIPAFSIVLTDPTTQTLTMTAAVAAGNAVILGKIVTAFNLIVADSVANVAANLDALQALSRLTSITLTGGTALAVTAQQYGADSAAISKITSATYTLSVAGVLAANAVSVAANSHVTSMTVVDSAASVAASIDALQSVVSKISSIAFTDVGTPTVSVTGPQFAADTAALAKMTGAFNVSVLGVTAANAAGVAAGAHVTALTVSDSFDSVLANLAALHTLGGKLTSITLTDGGRPGRTVTLAQLTADADVFNKIAGDFDLYVSGVAVANVASVVATPHVVSAFVSDSFANIVANLAQLEPLVVAFTVPVINLTDTGTPSAPLTAADYVANIKVFNTIGSNYLVTLSGAAAVNVLALNLNAHVTSYTVADTAGNIATNINPIENGAAGGKITSITVTDGATSALNVTSAIFFADTALFTKIAGVYQLSVSGVIAAQAASVASNSHVTSFTVSDTAADVAANLDALQALATGGKLASIAFTDTTPIVSLTSDKLIADAAAIGLFTGAYNFNITGTAGNDTINGGAGNDILSGGLGSDLLSGGAGDDTLIYSGDAIWSGPFTDHNEGSPVNPVNGEHIVIAPRWRSTDGFDGGAGYNTIKLLDGGSALFLDDAYSANPFGTNTARLRNIQEIDGGTGNDIVDLTSYTFSIGDVVMNGGDGDDVLWGNAGNDTINGGNGNDHLDGGSGNDVLTGGTGYDSYNFGRGDNADVINNGVATNPGVSGELDLGANIATNQLWLKQVGNNLQIDIMGTHDQVTISNWFGTPAAQLQEIKTADGSMLDAQLNQLVQAMATYSTAHAAFDPTTTANPNTPTDPTLQTAIAAAWHQ